MPARGYRNFTIKAEDAEKLEKYASVNGLKLVQLVSKIAEKIELDIPFVYLIKGIEASRVIKLKEAVDAEYLRDLLVRLYFHLQAIRSELQTLTHYNVDLGSFSQVKGLIAPVVDLISYQISRLEKILDETYPKGWISPLPPHPLTLGFIQPYRSTMHEPPASIIKERLTGFLKLVQNHINEAISILEKLRPHLPQLCESFGEALNQASKMLEGIYSKYLQ